MGFQAREIVSHVHDYEICIMCGDVTLIDYGYIVSWTLAECDLRNETDGRFFCSLECMIQWLDKVASVGNEEIGLNPFKE